jgi:hypothetical protein
MSPSIWPFLAAASVTMSVVLVMGGLHAGYANRISRVRVGGQGAVRLNLPSSQGRCKPGAGCRCFHLVRIR